MNGIAGFGLDEVRALTPVLILFATGLGVLVADLFRRGRSPHPFIHVVAAVGAGLSGVALLAGWGAAPRLYFEGALRIDLFARAFSGVVVLGTLLTCLCAPAYLRRRGIEDGEMPALVLFAAGAMVLLAMSQSLILLFLSLETFSLAVYVLSGVLRDEKRSVEGALKYLVLGGLASGFLLLGMAFLFGATGEARLDLMAGKIGRGEADRPLLLVGGALVLVGFGFKLGAFPFHSWIPDAYQGAPTLITGFMAVSVKAAALAALTRVALLVFDQSPPEAQAALQAAVSGLAIATCLFGNLVALVQSSVKRMLAYSGIAHTGYLLIGLAAALALEQGKGFGERGSSLVFYLLPYALMTFGAFAVMAFLGEDEDGKGGQEAEGFDAFRGLSRRRPLLALAMLIFLASLAGIPPTAGFWAKLYLFREAVAGGRWDLALVGILTSIVAVYYYLRPVVAMYLEPEEDGVPRALPADSPAAWAARAAIGLAAAGTALLGLFPQIFLRESVRSIQALLERI